MVSYADFITLLFATFTALFAISNADKAKFEALAKSIKKAFSDGPQSVALAMPQVALEGQNTPKGMVISLSADPGQGSSPPAPKGGAGDDIGGPGDSLEAGMGSLDEKLQSGDGESAGAAPAPSPTPSATPASTPTPAPAAAASVTPTPTPADSAKGVLPGTEGQGDEALAEELKELIDTAGLNGKVEVRKERRGMVISLGEAAFFATGESDVLAQSRPQLDRIVNAMRNKGFDIRIEGHTDDQPIRSGRYKSNWELSSMRASRIVEFMVKEYSFPAEHMSTAGYGPSKPIAPNDTEAGRQKNRRVDIVILNQSEMSKEP